jgi:hypothetical protein
MVQGNGIRAVFLNHHLINGSSKAAALEKWYNLTYAKRASCILQDCAALLASPAGNGWNLPAGA